MNKDTLEKIIESMPGWTKDSRSQKYINMTENSTIYYTAIANSGTITNTHLIIQTKKMTQEEIDDTDKRRYYFVCDEATEKHIEKALSGDNSMDLIIAVERLSYKVKDNKDKNIGTKTLTVDSMVFKLNEYVKNGVKDFHRIETIRKDNPENSFYAIVIKIPKYQTQNSESSLADGGDGFFYDITNLKTYLEISDSRTYKNFVDLTPTFRSDAKEELKPFESRWTHNMLIHGAPGTGKSRMIDDEAKKNFSSDSIRRVTFYEDYSYEKFVGAYMPVQKDKRTSLSFDGKNGSAIGEGISYEFKPGIMAQMLAEAYASLLGKYLLDNRVDKTVSIDELYTVKDAKKYLLIIEEINRAPAASVFGDMFQLLDRKTDGTSEYSINISDEFKGWFADRVTAICSELYEKDFDNISENIGNAAVLIAENLRLPPNLYIWATMNSADQGVFPLDSAFKRRWSYLYKSVLDNRIDKKRDICLPGNKKIDWDDFRTELNKAITEAGCTEEDKLIGTWYFNDNDFNAMEAIYAAASESDSGKMINPLCDKLIAYLLGDVFRNNPEAFFGDGFTAMSKIREYLNNSNADLDKIFRKFSTKKLVQKSSVPDTDDSSVKEPTDVN